MKLSIFQLFLKLKFPNVRTISTKKLARIVNDTKKPQPILIDARDEAEYEVSHLKAAVHIDPQTPNFTSFTHAKYTPIVVYCSVGYRSALISQKLQQAGFERVFNLDGGIFRWANEGRPLFKGLNQDLTPVNHVHPYNSKWGELLESQYRASISSS
jgi:rhodanese-related sulfurtransferase